MSPKKSHSRRKAVHFRRPTRFGSSTPTEPMSRPVTIGELWCRGPYTIRGYFRAPERNREAFTADGFYRTGDLVRLDPSGSLVVEGRIKDLINRGGEKINAEEIEAHLIAHPAVSAAAVVAMPDAVLGEKVVRLSVSARWRDSRACRDARVSCGSRCCAIQMARTNRDRYANCRSPTSARSEKSELRRDIAEKLAAERAALASGADAPQGN